MVLIFHVIFLFLWSLYLINLLHQVLCTVLANDSRITHIYNIATHVHSLVLSWKDCFTLLNAVVLLLSLSLHSLTSEIVLSIDAAVLSVICFYSIVLMTLPSKKGLYCTVCHSMKCVQTPLRWRSSDVENDDSACSWHHNLHYLIIGWHRHGHYTSR